MQNCEDVVEWFWDKNHSLVIVSLSSRPVVLNNNSHSPCSRMRGDPVTDYFTTMASEGVLHQI